MNQTVIAHIVLTIAQLALVVTLSNEWAIKVMKLPECPEVNEVIGNE